MDWKALSEFINSSGFPIVVALLLLYQLFFLHLANIKAINDLTTEFKLLRTELASYNRLANGKGGSPHTPP